MTWLAAALLLTAGSPGCIEVEGDRILARHLAAAAPAFGSLPAEQPLLFAPAPGARRVMSAQEMARLAARYGLAVEGVQACFERLTRPLDREQIIAALRKALGREDASIELIEFSRHRVPPGELEFPLAGLSTPATPGAAVLWRGRVRYDGNRSLPVWARVRIKASLQRLVAAENLAAGRPIEARQVRVEQGEWFPSAEKPLAAVEQAVGKLPRRWIRAGSVLYERLLTAPPEVERGQVVEVEVASGSAQLRFRARAETAGRSGDTVLVRSPLNSRAVAARVAGPGKVVINANAYQHDANGGVGGLGR